MKGYFLFISLLTFSISAYSFDHTHASFTKVLKENVAVKSGGKYTQLNYKNVNKKELKDYTTSLLALKKSTVDAWSREEQLAFYFNLYNALTIELVLTKYPVKSIKEIGSGFFLKNPWKEKFFTLFGKPGYLDKIEHELVRKNSKLFDPLLHVAFNCASIGCPGLPNEAFQASKLEEQLQNAIKNFLSDETRTKMKGKVVTTSMIFKWYRGDFEKGSRQMHSLEDLFAIYADVVAKTPADVQTLKSKKIDIKFFDYNWNLNDIK